MDIKDTREYRQLRSDAIRKAHKYGCVMYVVIDGDELKVTEDLEMVSTSDECILFCTGDGI